MARSKFLELLENATPLIADGAMGTVLHGRGEGFEECFDALNLKNPALVADVHKAYIDAGAQIIMTNTFGANRFKLAEHGLEDKVEEINCAAAQLAKRVVEASFKDILVAGDVGPLGVRLVPFGRVQLEDARAAFEEQIKALADCGLDLIIVETMTDLYEINEAVLAAKTVCDLPVVASMTFTRDDRTLLGDDPQKVVQRLSEAGADVIGVNCSGGPAQILRILNQMRQKMPEARFSVMPNAGWPEQVGGRIMYPAAPEYFGEYALAFRHAGASLIGGCCGTTPQHVTSMRSAIEHTAPEAYSNGLQVITARTPEPMAAESAPSPLSLKLADKQFVVAVEMSPPRGLSTHKLHAGAGLLADAGADVLNVADSPMARMRMSPWAVCELLQNKVGIEATLHFPTRGRNLLRLQGDLLAAHALGVRSVFVVMGDPTSIGDYPEAMDNFDLAPTGLIKLIKQSFNAGVDHSGSDIGSPTSFFVGAALNLTPQNPDREIKVLRRKLANGTDYFLTQAIYEPEKAFDFLEYYARQYEPVEKPILAGVLPLYGARHADFLHNEVPGINIPKSIRSRIEAAGEDGPSKGVEIALELVKQLKHFASGIYISPAFGRYDLVADLIEEVKEKDSNGKGG